MNPPKKSNSKVDAVDWEDLRGRLAAIANQDAAIVEVARSRKDKILRERATSLAKPITTEDAAEEVIDLVCFRLGIETYGIETRYVREVIPAPRVFLVPQADEVLVGVMNLRGEVLAVMEPRRIFGMSAGTAERRSVLVIGEGRAEFGIVVDEALEVARFALRAVIDPPDSGSTPGRQHIRGMTVDGMTIVNGGTLLADDRLYLDQSEEG